MHALWSPHSVSLFTCFRDMQSPAREDTLICNLPQSQRQNSSVLRVGSRTRHRRWAAGPHRHRECTVQKAFTFDTILKGARGASPASRPCDNRDKKRCILISIVGGWQWAMEHAMGRQWAMHKIMIQSHRHRPLSTRSGSLLEIDW